MIKYVCDVCDKETEITSDLKTIIIREEGAVDLAFNICKDCSKKLFNPVKRYGSSTTWSYTIKS